MVLQRAMAESVATDRARCNDTISSSSCAAGAEPVAGGADGRSAELLEITHVFQVPADSSVSNCGAVGASRHVATSAHDASITVDRAGDLT
jgi:hypothetical protein